VTGLLGDGLLRPGVMLEATTISLTHEPLPAEQVLAGTPTTGLAVLLDGPPEIGVWEMTPGTATDVEEDEFFVILAGRATLQIEGGAAIELGSGAAMQLTNGMRTVWTVHEALRKIYVS
jgi:uncharacterized protein